MKADKTAKSFPTYRIIVFSKFDSLDPTYQTSIYKQTKDRNETSSNLSLGTRLTVLSKRLGRKKDVAS